VQAAGNEMLYVTRGNQTVNTPPEPEVNQTVQPSVGNTGTESPIDSQLYNENTESAENLQGMHNRMRIQLNQEWTNTYKVKVLLTKPIKLCHQRAPSSHCYREVRLQLRTRLVRTMLKRK